MKNLILPLLLLIIFAYQPAPIDFWFNPEGECFGILEDGTEFSQVNIWTEPRIQKFSWALDFWYVSDIGIIEAENDLQALSIYFKRSPNK